MAGVKVSELEIHSHVKLYSVCMMLQPQYGYR